MIRAMLESGYRPSKQELNLINLEDGKVPNISAVKQIVEGAVRNPPSLLLSCRISIRNVLNKKLYKRVSQLEVPSRLKDLLLLNDILDT